MKNKLLKERIIIIVFLLIIFSELLYIVLKQNFKIINYNKIKYVEYNEKYTIDFEVCYGNFISCKKINPEINGIVKTNKIGKYFVNYIYKYNDKQLNLKQIVKVKDMTKPIIDIKSSEAIVCPNGKLSKLDYIVSDNYDKDLSKNVKTSFNKDKAILDISVKDSNGNISKKSIKGVVKDDEAPKITINGNENIYLFIDQEYTDEGAISKDNCDKVSVETTNDINNKQEGTYHITYTSTDKSGNKAQIQRNVIVKDKKNAKKVVYLTFDDGPSQYTNKLLDVLKKYNVKVTFFVTGKGEDSVILREYQEGHKVALHTNSHNYANIYSSVDNYFNDLNTISQRVERITGYKPNLIRFPGGSSNTVSKAYSKGIMSTLTKEVENRGYKYFDWNISSGDAGGTTSSDGVYNNVISSLKEESSIVLQHDTQEFSIDAVERIIKYCLENGYMFSTLDENSPSAHHGVNN